MTRCLRLNNAPNSRERDANARHARAIAVVTRGAVVAAIHDVAHSQHVIGREIATLARRLDHAVGDLHRALDEGDRTGDRQRVPAEGDFDATHARQLDEIAVVHAGQGERVGALGGEFLRHARVAHEAVSSS